MATKKSRQRAENHLRHGKKINALRKESVGYQGVDMVMPTGIVANVWIAITTPGIPVFLVIVEMISQPMNRLIMPHFF